MTRHQILAVGPRGTPSLVDVDAPSIAEARRSIARAGLQCIDDNPPAPAPDLGSPTTGRRFANRHPRFDLSGFSTQLLALLQAGLPISEALTVLGRHIGARGGDPCCTALLGALDRGLSFADALSLDPNRFPQVYVALVRGAEQTSGIPLALERYLRFDATVAGVRDRLVSAALYPAILIAVAIGVIAFLAGVVIPRFVTVYESIHVALPWSARLLLWWGTLVRDHGPLLAGGTALALGSAGCAVWHLHVKGRLIGWTLRQGKVGRLVREFHLTQMYRTTAMLLEGGIPAVAALGHARPALPVYLADRLDDAVAQIEQGRSVAFALSTAGLGGDVPDSLIAVGERSGDLAAMFDRAASFLEQENARWLERAMKVVEPALMLSIGLVIGGVVILLYLPIFELAGALR